MNTYGFYYFRYRRHYFNERLVLHIIASAERYCLCVIDGCFYFFLPYYRDENNDNNSDYYYYRYYYSCKGCVRGSQKEEYSRVETLEVNENYSFQPPLVMT